MLKNGHTTPIGSTRSSSPDQEDESGRIASLRKPVPEEDRKKRLGEKPWVCECKSHGSCHSHLTHSFARARGEIKSRWEFCSSLAIPQLVEA